ncbi:MAG TPA: LamG domain-containing protein, partial [Actinoplanes sp.]|nr:LamG domain-containing protein [Actinoplanes sp.]
RSAFYLMYQKDTGRWEFTVPREAAAGTVTWLTARSVTVPALNRWTHLAGVYDATAGQLTLYVDGVAEGVRAGVTSLPSAGPFRIGRSQSGGRFDGAISDVRAWNRALPVTEVSDRTVAWWNFDGASVDSSRFGRGTSLTSLGTSYTADGKGLALDGDGCAEGYGPALRTDRSWTVAARVGLAAVLENRTVISQSGPARDAFYLQYHKDYKKWAVLVPSSVDGTPVWKQALSTAAPALNTWTHLTAVYDAQALTLTLYVNGAAQVTTTGVVAPASTGRIHIGCSGSGGRFSGTIDDVRLYASALPAADVVKLAAGTVVR